VQGWATEAFDNQNCRLDDIKTLLDRPGGKPEGKKPPVFIGLGAVYNRKFEHALRGPYIPAFLRIGFKKF
jgi:hypothetical protein